MRLVGLENATTPPSAQLGVVELTRPELVKDHQEMSFRTKQKDEASLEGQFHKSRTRIGCLAMTAHKAMLDARGLREQLAETLELKRPLSLCLIRKHLRRCFQCNQSCGKEVFEISDRHIAPFLAHSR